MVGRVAARIQHYRKSVELPRKRLITQGSAPIAFHRGVVAGSELRRDHAFELIRRLNADQGIYRSMGVAA